MEASGVSFIGNTTANPMQLFIEWRNEVQEHDPYRFNDVMSMATIDE